MERSAFAGLVAALSAAMTMPAISRADVATIGAAKDNTIFQSNLNNSLGAGQAIFAGTNAQSSPRRGLIDFDIAGAIPAGATINSVQLTLFLNSASGGSTSSPIIHLYRLSDDWGEGTAGSTVNGAGGVGQGFAAGEGDVTWTSRHFSATTPTLWTSAGGDFAAADSAALAITGTTLNTPYTWQSTPAMVADVQGWLNSPSTNSGWLLMGDEGSASTVRGFWTREAARTGQGGFVPQLQVTYTAVPEPVAMLLVLMGSLLGIRRRGR
jgi:hypothetical protein